MRLALTASDLQQLAQTPADRAAAACLRLGRRGWFVGRREADGRRDGLVAIDAEALHERLAAGDTFTDLLAANDSWSLTAPAAGRDLQVVTGPHHRWQHAMVLDMTGARRVTGPGLELLVTRSGHYLSVDPAGELTELGELAAAQLVYRLPVLREDSLPPVLLAARHARRLVEALAAAKAADPAAAREGVRAAAAVTELLRRTVGADVRAQRGIAAQQLVDHLGSQEAARASLGIARSTLSELLSGR
ncbi:hypothetical protein WN990_16055 [Kitasatospora purpeofusca]|uniref:hypothetical protein n=1 Tax=Kitasatospora purpeofusca TaxID=67352 RepID=UPI0030F22963